MAHLALIGVFYETTFLIENTFFLKNAFLSNVFSYDMILREIVK